MHTSLKLAGLVLAMAATGCASTQPEQHQGTEEKGGFMAALSEEFALHKRVWTEGWKGSMGGESYFMTQKANQLQKAIAGTDFELGTATSLHGDEYFVVTMPADTAFEPDTAELTGEAQAILSKIGRIVGDNQFRVLITGHSDIFGTRSDLVDLDSMQVSPRHARITLVRQTMERASSVADHLFASGVRQKSISARGAGYSEPRTHNHTDAGRALNRRVEIALIPALR